MIEVGAERGVEEVDTIDDTPTLAPTIPTTASQHMLNDGEERLHWKINATTATTSDTGLETIGSNKLITIAKTTYRLVQHGLLSSMLAFKKLRMNISMEFVSIPPAFSNLLMNTLVISEQIQHQRHLQQITLTTLNIDLRQRAPSLSSMIEMSLSGILSALAEGRT